MAKSLEARIEALERLLLVREAPVLEWMIEIVESDEGSLGGVAGYALITAGPVQWFSPDRVEAAASAVLG
ncbi:MAG: hypothetical protein NTX56_05285 [Proteobacteria bacterium]|nr:hypothetical protein [Pseudomonadota bacterium]